MNRRVAAKYRNNSGLLFRNVTMAVINKKESIVVPLCLRSD